jgi:hypothetical protein
MTTVALSKTRSAKTSPSVSLRSAVVTVNVLYQPLKVSLSSKVMLRNVSTNDFYEKGPVAQNKANLNLKIFSTKI